MQRKSGGPLGLWTGALTSHTPGTGWAPAQCQGSHSRILAGKVRDEGHCDLSPLAHTQNNFLAENVQEASVPMCCPAL